MDKSDLGVERVLIVPEFNEPGLAECLSIFLRSRGVSEVVITDDASLAYEHIRDDAPYGLLISGVWCHPGERYAGTRLALMYEAGVALLKDIRRLKNGRNLPIMVVTHSPVTYIPDLVNGMGGEHIWQPVSGSDIIKYAAALLAAKRQERHCIVI